jgi:hypothetical protein
MHLRRDRVETTIRLLAAGAGTVLAHTVDYAALFPDRGARSRVLAATGHGYWHLAVLAAMAAGLAAAALVVARGASHAVRHEPEAHGDGFRLLDVIIVQVGVFAGIELLERVSAGLSPTVLLHERVFRLGIAMQVVVGIAVAVALAVLHRAGRCVGEAIARARLSPNVPPATTWPSPALTGAPRTAARRARRQRGPPLLA